MYTAHGELEAKKIKESHGATPPISTAAREMVGTDLKTGFRTARLEALGLA